MNCLEENQYLSPTKHSLVKLKVTAATSCVWSLFVKIRSLVNTVTVEPAMFLHSLGTGVGSMFRSYMIEDKICLNHFKYAEIVCANLDSGDFNPQEDAVDKMTSVYEVYQRWLVYLPSTFVLLFLGIWGDLRGRKLPLLLPLCGSLLMALGFLVNAIWWSWPPGFILMSFLPFGISGGRFALSMAVYTYVSDSSGDRSRTSRMSIVAAFGLLAGPLGKTIGTFLYNKSGYVAIFGSQVIIYGLAILHVVLRLHNHPKSSSDNKDSEFISIEQVPSPIPDGETQITVSLHATERSDLGADRERDRHKCGTFLTLSNFKRAVDVALKKRENGGRGFIFAYFFVVSITVFAR
ncbi:hypothetical protein SK128_020661, partial [Halocaridina rubra]